MPQGESEEEMLAGVDNDPNKPDIPPIADTTTRRREAREARRETRRANRYERAVERYGEGSSQAQRYAPEEPTQQMSAEQANAAIGVGGDQELVAAIRELIAAVRSMSGN